jgi:hypothetical protein
MTHSFDASSLIEYRGDDVHHHLCRCSEHGDAKPTCANRQPPLHAETSNHQMTSAQCPIAQVWRFEGKT